jgi:uncharacterized membrane protein
MAARIFAAVVVALVLLGIVAGVGRAIWLTDLGSRMEPARDEVFQALSLTDPDATQRALDVQEFDRRYAENPAMTLMHVVFGSVFLAAALLQFTGRVRTRYPLFHRWLGRVLVVSGLAVTVSALYFALLMPFAGMGETIVIVLFGGLFAFALVRAWLAIRRSDVALHRRWMIRAFAVAIGISLVRVAGIPADLAGTAYGLAARPVFVISLWVGFTLAVVAGELYVSATSRA